MTVSKVVANVRMLVPVARYYRSGVGCLTFLLRPMLTFLGLLVIIKDENMVII